MSVDFSEHGQRAFDSALALASDLGAGMVLVHAFPSHFVPAEVSPETAVRLEGLEAHADVQDAVRLTTELGAKARARGVDVESVAAPGDPAKLIIETARRMDAALIVVGTRARSGLSRFLLGSVAEAVVRTARRPVLVVPPMDA